MYQARAPLCRLSEIRHSYVLKYQQRTNVSQLTLMLLQIHLLCQHEEQIWIIMDYQQGLPTQLQRGKLIIVHRAIQLMYSLMGWKVKGCQDLLDQIRTGLPFLQTKPLADIILTSILWVKCKTTVQVHQHTTFPFKIVSCNNNHIHITQMYYSCRCNYPDLPKGERCCVLPTSR